VLADADEASTHGATLLEAAALESFCNRPKRARALLDAHLAFFFQEQDVSTNGEGEEVSRPLLVNWSVGWLVAS
jgi:hypothetical protein